MMNFRWVNFPLPDTNIVGLVIGYVLGIFFPVPIFTDVQTHFAAGLPILLFGLGFCVWSVAEASGMEIASPEKLITSGPYALSRNPMYVGWSFIHLGIAFLLNSVWLIVSLVLAFAYIHFVEIPAEERYLESQFGEEFNVYRDQVRRYL